MATYTQRPSGWYVQVRRKGHKTIGRTFNTKAEGERWALSIESSMGVGTYVDNREALSTTLKECLDRYESEITPTKKSAKRESQRIDFFRNEALALRGIGTIKSADIAKWRDERLKSVSGTTVQKDLALLSHLFTIAIKEWGLPLTNVVQNVRKPRANKGRDRRLHDGEEEAILKLCSPDMRAFIVLALETAMRRGEIAELRRSWIKGRVAYLPDTKNDTARAVPLSTRAVEAIASLPARIDGRLFEFEADTYTRRFESICAKLGIEDLVLHDLRHEATSRMFEKGLDMMQVSSITGHKSLQMLKRYTHFKAHDLAKLLG